MEGSSASGAYGNAGNVNGMRLLSSSKIEVTPPHPVGGNPALSGGAAFSKVQKCL
jgi:hypothetical protein